LTQKDHPEKVIHKSIGLNPAAPSNPSPSVSFGCSAMSSEDVESQHHTVLDDPFALRKGRTLVWKDVCMTLKGKDGTDKPLLHNVWGEVPPQQTTAM
jgi:hypothetical protein